MAISRFSSSRVTQGLPKYQSAWDQDGVAAGAIEPIGSIIAQGGLSDYSFNNIPQVYKDLMLVAYVRADKAATETASGLYVGDGTNLFQSNQNSWTQMAGDGSHPATSTKSQNASGVFLAGTIAASTTTGYFTAHTVHLLNYRDTNKFKHIIAESSNDRNGSGGYRLTTGLVRTTNAIQNVGMATYGDGNYISGSTFTLYGIRG